MSDMHIPLPHMVRQLCDIHPISHDQPFHAAWYDYPFVVLSHAVTGESLVQATVVRLVATPHAMWLRFDCADVAPQATLRGHDEPIYTEEVVELFIAQGATTPIRYCEFQVNPLNTRFDGMIDNPHEDRVHLRLDTSWDPPWQSWVQCDASGWQVVMCIPWGTLGAESPLGHWRLNLLRIDRGFAHYPSEESAWSPPLRQPADFHVPSRFGVLEVLHASESV